jgi:predicted porin
MPALHARARAHGDAQGERFATRSAIRRGAMALAASAGLLADAASAQSNVTLYGILDEGVDYVTNAGAGGHLWSLPSGVRQGSRFGVRGSEELGGGTKAVFTLESGFHVHNGQSAIPNSFFGRQTWVGLSNRTAGTLTLGRQYDLMGTLLGANFAAGSTYGGNYQYHFIDIDRVSGQRIDNSVLWMSPEVGLGGGTLSGGAMYGFGQSPGRDPVSGREFSNFNKRTVSAGLLYAKGAFKIGGAYTNINDPHVFALGSALPIGGAAFHALPVCSVYQKISNQRIAGVGASYDFGKVWLHGMATNTRLKDYDGHGVTAQAYEVGTKVSFAPAWYAGLDYAMTRIEKNTYHQLNSIVDYSLSKRTDVYGMVSWQRALGPTAHAKVSAVLPSSTSGNQIVYRVGMRHRF